MSAQFKAGDIAILQNGHSGWARFNGEEVTIIGGLELRETNFHGTQLTYCVIHPEFHKFTSNQSNEVYVLPSHLRRRNPPEAFAGEMRVRELFDVAPVKEGVPA